MEAIILAGGFGTRLSQVVRDVPKPMADVAGRPFLEYILDCLIQQGVDRIVLAVHYKKECILRHFGEHYRGVQILYSVEETPLFTGGAIKKALSLCNEDFVWVVNGDTHFEVPMEKMMCWAAEKQTSVTIAVKKMNNFSRYGRIMINGSGIITSFCEKEFCETGYINGGVYYLKRIILEGCPEKFSMENECFPVLLKQRDISAFESHGYFIDIGIPEDYQRAQKHFCIGD